MAAYDATGFLPRILERLAARYGGNVVGASLIVLSSFTLAAMMASAKDLSASYSVWQIVLIRSFGVAVMLTPVIVRSGAPDPRSNPISSRFTESSNVSEDCSTTRPTAGA